MSSNQNRNRQDTSFTSRVGNAVDDMLGRHPTNQNTNTGNDNLNSNLKGTQASAQHGYDPRGSYDEPRATAEDYNDAQNTNYDRGQRLTEQQQRSQQQQQQARRADYM